MPRHSIYSAVIFSVKPLGENNASVRLFAKDGGILYATLYGGRKSRLRSLASPWNAGTAYLSHGRDGASFKLSDFDVRKYHLSFREDLLKNYAAALAAELVIKTGAGGGSKQCWPLLNGFIDGMELCQSPEECRAALIRFLWRFLNLLGLQPDIRSCPWCGRQFWTGNSENSRVQYQSVCKTAVYNPADNNFVCLECLPPALRNTASAALSLESMRYLAAVSALPAAESRRITLSAEADAELRQFLYRFLEGACGLHFNSLKTGAGIL